jgi:membrane-bound lytic murein transglycosylase D
MGVRALAMLAGIWMISALTLAQDQDDGLPPQAPASQSLAPGDETLPPDSKEPLDSPAGDGEEARSDTGGLFPTAPVIERQKAFWVRIFSEVRSNQGLIHDGELTQPIYEKLDLGELSLRNQRALIRKRIDAVSARLRDLAAALAAGAEPDEDARRLMSLFPEQVTPGTIRQAARNVRFQRGLADRFLRGLIHSGLYLERMRKILADHGVPGDLAYLPHVESSFNYRTYSRAGAAGIWQFTHGTGTQYMRIGYEVDERLDPLLSTRAAAALLADNYAALESWPLAITAYNHGRQSLMRIVARTGTRDLAHLIEHYDGWLFKFASKNFYAEFLAAREVANDPERYFGPVETKPPLRFHHVELPFYADFKQTARLLGLERDLLEELNPSLRPPVLQGMKYVPKGYTLRLPEAIPPDQFMASIPDGMRYPSQKRTTEVVVMRGDTLYELGKRHSVSWQEIAVANNISAFRSIRPGQRLILPGAGRSPRPTPPGEPLAAAGKSAPQAPGAPAPSEEMAPAGPPAAAASGRPALALLPDSSVPAPLPESLAFQRAEGASLFQDLELHHTSGRRAELIAAYGETLGHYGEWAGVPTETLRRLNGGASLGVIRPGDRIAIPLTRVSAEDFLQKRLEYHHGREEDFYSVYAVTELSKVRVRRGDTAWSIAQSTNVPMWLFYQHNPTLIDGALQAGTTVLVPVIEEIQDIQRSEPATRSGQAG